MGAFNDTWGEVMAHVPRVDALLAQRFTLRAFRDLRDARIWSWLIGEGALNSPASIGTGTVTVTQFSTTVNLSVAANAALNNLQNPLITKRQFRVFGSAAIYNIVAYDNGAATLTLDRMFLESTNATAQYMVYRCYYDPPDTDFLSFLSIINTAQNYAIVGPRLRATKPEIDARDPIRASQGNPWYVAGYKQNTTTGLPIYELWPQPVTAMGFPCLYRKRGANITASNDLPASVNPDILTVRALYYACDWAMTNAATYRELLGVDWRLKMGEQNRNYQRLLRDAIRNDNELLTQDFFLDWHRRWNVPLATGYITGQGSWQLPFFANP